MKLFWLVTGFLSMLFSYLSLFQNNYSEATYWTLIMLYSRYEFDKIVEDEK